MEIPEPRDFSYFQSNRSDADIDDPLGTRAFHAAVDVLEDPQEIKALLADYVAWRLKQHPPADKATLRILIHECVKDLTHEVVITYGESSITKSLAQVWRDAMNQHPFLRL